MSYASDLGKRLRLARKFHGATMRDFLKPYGIPSSTICRIEQGKSVEYETGKKIEEWLADVGEPEECDGCDGLGFVKK